MDKERLYYHYAKGFDLMDLAKEFRDDLPEFMEFYDIYKGVFLSCKCFTTMFFKILIVVSQNVAIIDSILICDIPI